MENVPVSRMTEMHQSNRLCERRRPDSDEDKSGDGHRSKTVLAREMHGRLPSGQVIEETSKTLVKDPE